MRYNIKMGNKVFINKNSIVECQVVGDQTLESINAMGQQITELLGELKRQQAPLLILDDLTHIGRVPSEGRKAVINLVKTLEYERLVMLGNSGLLRVGVNLIARATGKKDKKMRYFTNRSQAIDWLKGK